MSSPPESKCAGSRDVAALGPQPREGGSIPTSALHSLKLDFCSHEAAKYAVERWHYLHAMPSGKLVQVGVWENDKFIGVVLFGRGANNTLGRPYGLTQIEVCELVRVALTKHVSTVTRIVSIAIRLLRKLCPNLRLIVSFADPEHGHHGGIYQGGGWLYCGMTRPTDEYIVNGKRMHGRSMRDKFGTHIGRGFTKIIGSSKHRYLMPLDAAMKTQIEPLRMTYPKRSVGTGDSSAAASDQKKTEIQEGESGPV